MRRRSVGGSRPVPTPEPRAFAPVPAADPGWAYVRLARRLDRVVPGVLDADLGDPAQAARVGAEPPPEPLALAREADERREALAGAGLPVRRHAVLEGQLRAVAVVARHAAGRGPGFVEEVRESLGVDVAPGDTDRYRAAHDELAALLPGPGALADRLARFRESDRVGPDDLGPAVRALAEALRQRTADALGLPAGERVDVEVVASAPWSGFSRRSGPRHSVVSVNAGAGHRLAHLPLLVAHETYPGHHTEHCRMESVAAPLPERTVLLSRSPQSLVAEGAAELALDALIGRGWGRWSAEVLRAAGLHADPDLGEVGEAVERAMDGLAEVRQDAALMLHASGAGRADAEGAALAHLRRWLLIDDGRARRMLEFLAHPRWRTHTTTYVEGARLLRPWLAARPPGQPLLARFARLLDESWTPRTLRPAEHRSGATSGQTPV